MKQTWSVEGSFGITMCFAGFMIAIMRGYINEDVIAEAFNKPKIDIPRAPGLGLLLDNLKYEGCKHYNSKVCEKLDWLEYEVTFCG